MGVGNFFGLLPESMQGSKLYGVELDSITGRIESSFTLKRTSPSRASRRRTAPASLTSPSATSPSASTMSTTRSMTGSEFSIHNYFAAKMLDQVRPGGIDASSPRATRSMPGRASAATSPSAARCSARLGSPTTPFVPMPGRTSSRTSFFSKDARPRRQSCLSWVHVGTTPEGFTVNRYFLDHPDMVLGTPTAEARSTGGRTSPSPPSRARTCPSSFTRPCRTSTASTPSDVEEAENTDILPADPDVSNYSFTLVDGEVYYRGAASWFASL